MYREITLKHSEIYDNINLLNKELNEELKFPAKVSFYIEKNLNCLLETVKEIEEQRISMLAQFGAYNQETQQFDVFPEKSEEATAAIESFLNTEKTIELYMIRLDAFEGVNLSIPQIKAFSFMIEEE